MNYLDKVYKLRQELLDKFDLIVKKGAKFPTLIDVEYPYGNNPEGMMTTTEGRSTFLAKEIVANSKYNMFVGEDIIVSSGIVEFIESEGTKHLIEPDTEDLYWMAIVVDEAIINN
jgi:hypothetical protein